MYLDTSTKIKLIAKKKGTSVPKLAKELGVTMQALYQKLQRNTWDEEDLKAIAEKLGCQLDISFIDKETGERY